jgi:mono/diheme cytochrome c family protein
LSERKQMRVWILTAAVSIVVLAAVWSGSYIRAPKLTPELRGLVVADRLGCFACHGPGGVGGVPNPGSEVKEVPAWDGGTAMMYVENEAEIREWILYGRPQRLAERHERPARADSAGAPPLHMPAYEGVVSEADLEDLVAYYKAVSAFDTPPPEAREGYRAAKSLGCFGCHGPGGLVGSSNPKSFKGYIPPWRGRDFEELVRNEAELRQWVLDGTIDRLESSRVARHYMRRQVIRMPAFRDALQPGELDAIVRYIQWLGHQTGGAEANHTSR